jgi:hypothetical protein
VSVASSKAKLAGLVAHRDPADPEIARARADLAAAHDERAVDDPAALARAARIVRIALERGKLTRADLAEGDDAEVGRHAEPVSL